MKKISCLLGFHKLRPIDFGDMNYKDERHGYIEQDYFRKQRLKANRPKEGKIGR